MTNNAIHQSLIELEENLKGMASARMQVQSIAQDSEKLITAVSKLIKDVEKLRVQYADAAKGISGELTSGVKQFTTAIGGQIRGVEEVVTETVTRSEATASKFTGGLSDIQKNLERTLATTNASFQKQLEQGASEMLDQSKQLFDKSRESLDGLIGKIERLESSLSGLKDRIDNTDFSKALDIFQAELTALNNKVSEFANESKSRDEAILIQLRNHSEAVDKKFKLVLAGLVVITILLVAGFFIK